MRQECGLRRGGDISVGLQCSRLIVNPHEPGTIILNIQCVLAEEHRVAIVLRNAAYRSQNYYSVGIGFNNALAKQVDGHRQARFATADG